MSGEGGGFVVKKGTRCGNDTNVFWYHSYFVWLFLFISGCKVCLFTVTCYCLDSFPGHLLENLLTSGLCKNSFLCVLVP